MSGLQVLHRPSTLKNFLGNKDVIEAIGNVVTRPDPPSAFLFVGPAGCGKTTLGRITARMLKCHKADFLELNAANDRGIKGIRKIIEDTFYAPLKGKKKVILFDEAHMLTKESQEALLKALEEPPPHVHYIICTTNPEALKGTLKRRCHSYELSPMKSAELINLMKYILEKEKVQNFSEKVLDKIVDLSDGSPGQALKLLDMVIDFKEERKAIAVLKNVGATEQDVLNISRVLTGPTGKDAKWARIKKMIPNIPVEGETARRAILGYLEKVLLNNGGDDVAQMMEFLEKNFFDSGRSGLTLALYKCIYLTDGE